MKHRYIVFVDDNFHYMDEDERYRHGEFDDCESAVKACKKIVDESLLHHYEPGMTVEQLLTGYIMFGEDPFVSTTDRDCFFSGRDYARQRCAEICRAPPRQAGLLGWWKGLSGRRGK